MDFGLVLQTDPPAQTVIARMKEAEGLGFTHGWTFDSTVLSRGSVVVDGGEFHGREGHGKFLSRELSQYLV